MDRDKREIKSIAFGIFSPEEILGMSVCKINIAKKSGYGTVYDERMGTTDSTKPCETCGQTAEFCPGHFGHIEFNEPIIHPLFYKRVVTFLNCFCCKCNRLLITRDQIYLEGLNRYKGESRFVKIQEKIKKVDICCNNGCGAEHPKFKFCSTDSSICKIYESKEKIKTSIVVTVEEIKKQFDNLLLEDVELLGINAQLAHPRNYILSVLPVLPICARPFVKADNNLCDDDLTNQYAEIIKINNHLETDSIDKSRDLTDTKRQKFLASLRFRVLTTFNNGQGKAKHSTNGRAVKGMKERLAGKDGQIRNNMMGKRCNQTGRTVIGPDPTLSLGDLGVPIEQADKLSIPVQVTTFNLEKMQELVNSNKADFVIKPDGKTRINLKRYRRGTRLIAGDIIIRGDEEIEVKTGREMIYDGDKVRRNGNYVDKLLYANRDYKIDVGWIVQRKLQDGDYVLLNRQPTLHKASMMAMRVVRKPYKTLRMNLAITKPFNADFDGDEMNLHIPQSLEAQVEMKMISAAKFNIISAQSSKPNIAIVQDSLLGAYRMTLGEKRIERHEFFDITEKLKLEESVLDRLEHVRKIYKIKGKNLSCYSGKGLISMFLPRNLYYEKKNNADAAEPVVKIYAGVLYEGTLNKDILGSAHNSLIQIMNKEYSADAAIHFVDCIQFVTNAWNLLRIFTVGLGDCLVTSKEKETEIQDVIDKCYIEAEGIKNTTSHEGIQEVQINAALGKAKDIGLRIAKESLDPDNNFLSTVISGSKGDFFNIAQITGLLGQQNLKGQRVPLYLNNGKRSLPHYPFGKLSPEMEHESRGFIASSFIKGLNPREFYFHAMSGREGISDTAMGTATSGYMQRRIIKLTEDIKIQNDGTVRDITGHIYQMAYGDDGLDPTNTVKVNGNQEACDIGRLINKLNMEYMESKK